MLDAARAGEDAAQAQEAEESAQRRLASAESTLSGTSFLSSPIGANRKSLNSDPRAETAAERVIPTTGLRRLCRTYRADIWTRFGIVASKPNHIARRQFHLSLGIYLDRSDRRFAAGDDLTFTSRLDENSPKIIIRYQGDRDQRGDERNHQMVGPQAEKRRALTRHSRVPRT